MGSCRVLTSVLGIIITILMIATTNSEAGHPPSLMEQIESALRADPGFSADECETYLDAFRKKLAAYGRDIIRGERERGAEVLMDIVVEGSFDRAPVGRTVEVASAAYIAVRRGSDPDTVRGIALYGFRKQVDADRIGAWANGYGTLVKFGVPPHVAEDLIFQAVEHGWDIYTFDTFKWGLVDAVRSGYTAEDFEAYMVGTYLVGGERPGGMVARSMRYFRSLGGVQPELPEYKGSFIPRAKKDMPAPRLDLTRGDGAAPASAPEAGPSGENPDMKAAPGGKGDKPVPAQPQTDSNKKKTPPSALGYLLRIEDSYRKYLGVPYAWRGTTKQGMDCSGFVQRVYAEAGISLPRMSREQWTVGEPVARYAIREGDLVFFRTLGNRISHVGIVTRPAQDEFVHASSSKGVSYALLTWRYFDKRYAGARRIVPGEVAITDREAGYRSPLLFIEASR
jgi:cell wall-associated NlpC family hydrolase